MTFQRMSLYQRFSQLQNLCDESQSTGCYSSLDINQNQKETFSAGVQVLIFCHGSEAFAECLLFAGNGNTAVR